MLLFTPIFFWILAFGDAKYEWIEYNKKYSWKKWILITLWISLLVWCCSAGIKYYQYKDFYDYLNSFEYDYKVSDENDNIENNITKTDIHEDINEDYVWFKEDILVISGGINNEIGDNTNSEESENLQINSNERNKENTWYIPTNITWIDEIAKNYKWVIIKSSDLIDSSKDWNYRTKPELKKRTLFIDENNGFILKIWPEWIWGFMEIYFNDINEISKIIVSDRDYIRMFDMSIYPHGECDKMDWRYGNEIVWDANDNFVFTKASRYERYMKWVELITHKNNWKTLKEILIENHCVCDGTFWCE